MLLDLLLFFSKKEDSSRPLELCGEAIALAVSLSM